MLVVDDATYSHAGQTTEYCFTMEAAPGEVTAISGASGSGKSTLLDLVAGFLRPRAGTISLDGRDLTALLPEQRPVSILFQSESLFDHLSAAHNLALGLPPKMERQEVQGRIGNALAEVGLSGIEGQRAETLSGGQKQRVALARTLLRDRPVLLLDEPFSALDDDTRVAVRDLVGDLTRRQNWITILVSHHADDVEALAARRYRIKEGRLVAEPGTGA
jgi:thiamine transport system ATP-binding protein